MIPRVVLDTNVLVAAIRSRRGASFRLLSLVGTGAFEIALTVPLVIEYESVLKKHARAAGLTHKDVDDLLDYLCSEGHHQAVYFLWRPILRDLKDDMVLEAAVESDSDFLVTFNVKDFSGTEKFNVEVIEPRMLLQELGELK